MGGHKIAKVTILFVGVQENPILSAFLDVSDVEFNIICNNILDFELPPLVENAAPIWHRHELRNVLKQIGPSKFEISTSLENLLKENDRLDLDEEYLGVTSHISQIEQNSKDLLVAYNLLLEQTDLDNISLYPLVKKPTQLLAMKNKKVAPLRYYHLKGELLDQPIPESIGKKKSKEFSIPNKQDIAELKLSEPALKAMNDGDLIVIIPTDMISLGVFLHADELEKQIKNIQTPLVMLWPFDASGSDEQEEYQEEIIENLGFGFNLESFAKDLSFITDYVIIKKSDKEQLKPLRNAGCHVLLSDFYDEENEINENLLKTILGVSDLEDHLSEPDTGDNQVKDADDTSSESSSSTEEVEESPVEEDVPKTGKKISQLVESPEEAGKERAKESNGNNDETDSEISEIISNITKRESEIQQEDRPLKIEDNPDENGAILAESPSPDNGQETSQISDVNGENNTENGEIVSEEEDKFKVREEEDWIDTVKRAIEQSFEENNDEALAWLIEQSGNDADREMQIAELAIAAWVDVRSTPDRKRGAEILSTISKNNRETYVQILQRQMLQAVKEMQEDKRRILIALFSLIRDIDLTFSEQLIRGITKELAALGDEEEISVLENAKLSILQLVIQSRALTRICIQELLTLLDSKPNVGPELWNILLAFDAGSISLELVTNFSISKAEELIRRSNLLRFTGSYYSTINKVIQAWKEGDKGAISSATGSILPEETLRKFERLELARKVDKLKMVQLSTLAESLGKDAETVERLITELIVNDELKAEMKLIDEKMYLVSSSEQDENSGK